MAASSLGRLTLDLLVRLAGFEQGLDAAERRARESSENMKQAFSGFKEQIADALGGTQIGSIIDGFNSRIGNLKGGVLVAGAALAGMAAGGVVVGAGALAKMAIETAKADAQLQILANRANISTKNFQVLEYAASGLGVSQDQLGSIFADVQEKLGEFSATKGGGAADFFDALKNNTKMTDDQIKAFGKTLQGKDGVEAVQMLNDKMDELGATSQERRFVFESLASDLGNLAPLFAENGSLLSQYGEALEEAGVIKSKEALEQSKLLAAQTESVHMRFDGFKNQLTAQMMPALNSVIGYFLQGADKGGQFGGVIQSVGYIAKGVGVVIIGVAASIEVLIKLISGFIDQAKNVADTAVNVWNADGAKAKAQALTQGLSDGFTIANDTFVSGISTVQKAMDGMGGVIDSSLTKLDKLSQANLAVFNASQQSAKGIKTNTEEADENAKAAEKLAAAQAKAAKEAANLNKMVGASALSGLRIKSSEAFAGGGVRAYTADFAQLAQKQLGSVLSRFTAFNDTYHKGTNSKHATGNAFDFTIADASKSAEAVTQLESVAKRYGYVVKVLDEYRNPSSRATGGHLHVSVLGFKGTADAAKQAQDELSLVAQTNEEAARIQAETQRAQQSVVQQYLTDREKLEVDHGQKLKAINDAFAGDSSAIQKYTDLQNAAYKKDVTEYESQQKLKEIAERKTLLEVRKNWMTAGSYAQNYYALVREEILATAEYSPDMKHALIKETNLNQGMEQNAEREQTWSDYQNRFEMPNYYEEDVKLLQAARDQMLITDELYYQKRALLHTQWGQNYFAGTADVLKSILGEESGYYMAAFSLQKGYAAAQVALNAPETYSNVYNSVSAIPYVGPYLAPVMAGAAIALQLAQAATIGSVSFSPAGYADGGFTGYGGKYEPAGIVHRGEGVLTQEEIAALGGPAGFFALRQSIKNGFADGGLALDAPKVLNMQSPGMSGYMQQAQQSSQANVNLNPNFVIVDERQSLSDYLYSPDGTKAFVKFFKRNRAALGV
ncbi:hypothetical protein [Acinetobacter tandoii]|uniref:hypothetical protein n=1 Tax=Acinetobacter tandoii TaxID=202954 RepID=UPI0030193CF7